MCKHTQPYMFVCMHTNELAQMVAPPFVTRWKVRSWVQVPLGAYAYICSCRRIKPTVNKLELGSNILDSDLVHLINESFVDTKLYLIIK